MKTVIGRTVIELVKGDITRQDVEAIVNAANTSLLGGGGVDGAIHKAGGPAILEACRKNGPIKTGEAVITTGGWLKGCVIHGVGPVYGGRSEDSALLKAVYTSAMRIVAEKGLKSVAFPSISTGAYRYPVEEAAPIAVGAVVEFLKGQKHNVELVRFVLFDERTFEAYRVAVEEQRKGEARYGG